LLHQPRVDQDAVVDGEDRRRVRVSAAFELGLEPREAWQRSERLQDLAFIARPNSNGDRGVKHITQMAATGLLDTGALANLAASLQQLDADAIFAFERLPDGLMRRWRNIGRVDDDLALTLGSSHHSVPIRCGLGGHFRCNESHGPDQGHGAKT
jgi:hypothetical protein